MHVKYDTTMIIKAPKVDTTGFSAMKFADRFKRAFGDPDDTSFVPALPIKADSLPVSNDTSKAPVTTPIIETKPQVTQANTVNEDSVRQAIIDSAVETRFLLAELYATS